VGRHVLPAHVVLLTALALAAGCGGASTPPPLTRSASTEPESPGISGPASVTPALPPGTFTNPVLADDFPDPFVMRNDNVYYAYATTDGAQHLQLARSPDLVHWDELHDPLPKLPRWSSGDTWAPEVVKLGSSYSLYYTAHDPDLKRPDGNGSQCVTVAIADSPEGPFVDQSSNPLVCQADKGGSIDATYFRDADGTS
jgi:beta-xylosidase